MIWRDTLLIANGIQAADRLHFVSEQQQLSEVGQRYPIERLLTVSELTLGTRHELEQNISFQNVVEQLTIKIVQALTGKMEERS